MKRQIKISEINDLWSKKTEVVYILLKPQVEMFVDEWIDREGKDLMVCERERLVDRACVSMRKHFYLTLDKGHCIDTAFEDEFQE